MVLGVLYLLMWSITKDSLTSNFLFQGLPKALFI